MEILKWVLVFWFGASTGYVLSLWVSHRFREYSGTMVVNKDARLQKTVYSLELDDYPEKLEFKKVVLFKVNTSDQSSDRK